jgi:hypothetical protein
LPNAGVEGAHRRFGAFEHLHKAAVVAEQQAGDLLGCVVGPGLGQQVFQGVLGEGRSGVAAVEDVVVTGFQQAENFVDAELAEAVVLEQLALVAQRSEAGIGR